MQQIEQMKSLASSSRIWFTPEKSVGVHPAEAPCQGLTLIPGTGSSL